MPYGETVSYGELAERAGRLRAARAAGNVCARGTLEVIVPYHRVIASDGSIGSYGADGLPCKRRLLALEGVQLWWPRPASSAWAAAPGSPWCCAA